VSELADDEPSLLNVDLVLESDRPFDQLSEALSASLFAMDEGSSVSPAPPYRARFETNLVHWSTVREVVDELAAAIDRLPPEALAQWERLSSRVFDVGLQAGLRCAAVRTRPRSTSTASRRSSGSEAGCSSPCIRPSRPSDHGAARARGRW